MSPSHLIARQSLATLARDRSVLLLVAFFAAMVAVTAFLGWSATATVDAIYADAAQFLSASGQPVPPNPVGQTAPLAVLRNLGVYVSLVGAFSAIVIGQQLVETDRRAGILPLIGSRPLARRDLAFGKMLALVIATGGMMCAVGIIAATTLIAIPSLSIGAGDLVRLALFVIAGWVYITIFGFLAIGAAARMPATASGLIAATVVWLVVTFVFPALTANIHPTAAINPISTLAATPDAAAFRLTSAVLGPFSISEGFSWLSASLLGFLPDGLAPRGAVPPALMLILALLVSAGFAVRATITLDPNVGGPDA